RHPLGDGTEFQIASGAGQRPERLGNKLLTQVQGTIFLSARDRIRAQSLLRPEELLSRVVKRRHAPWHRRIAAKFAQRIIVKKRRGTPDADQRRHPVVSRSGIFLLRLELDRLRRVKRVIKIHLTGWSKVLVGLRGKIIPDMSCLCVRAESSRGVRSNGCERVAPVV